MVVMTELAKEYSFQRNECTLCGGSATDAAAHWYVIPVPPEISVECNREIVTNVKGSEIWRDRSVICFCLCRCENIKQSNYIWDWSRDVKQPARVKWKDICAKTKSFWKATITILIIKKANINCWHYVKAGQSGFKTVKTSAAVTLSV